MVIVDDGGHEVRLTNVSDGVHGDSKRRRRGKEKSNGSNSLHAEVQVVYALRGEKM